MAVVVVCACDAFAMGGVGLVCQGAGDSAAAKLSTCCAGASVAPIDLLGAGTITGDDNDYLTDSSKAGLESQSLRPCRSNSHWQAPLGP